MNEQIKQLWVQAAEKTQGDSWEEQTKFIERFAELIVLECADIAKHNVMNISTYGDAEFVEEQIKQHFRVEE